MGAKGSTALEAFSIIDGDCDVGKGAPGTKAIGPPDSFMGADDNGGFEFVDVVFAVMVDDSFLVFVLFV